ncbi:MAG: hypothetical protein ACLTWG_00295 [Blautia sp.]|uniref:hypothetical protein n=1 Tax=Blautia sp. TaxID=1955243 RepID=UPI0039961AF6
MIHIKLSSSQISNIKEKWAFWFFKAKRINKFIAVLDEDAVFRQFLFEKADYNEWKKQYKKRTQVIKCKDWQFPVMAYFFEDLSDKDCVLKKYAKKLKPSTVSFLLCAYNSYRQSITLAQIIDEIGIQVCPYCNRNFIDRYALSDWQGNKKFYYKGDLDHYYSKNEIPALILSFYNLIPCCKVCNHEKHDSNLRTFHPYYDYEDEEYCFSIELYSDEDEVDIIYEKPLKEIENKRYDSTVWQGVSDNFKIIFKGIHNSELDESMENSNKVFRLEKKYNHSKEYVKELIRKQYIYPEIKKKELLKNFPEIFKTESDLDDVFFSTSSLTIDKAYDRPLSKLTKDILKQLG